MLQVRRRVERRAVAGESESRVRFALVSLAPLATRCPLTMMASTAMTANTRAQAVRELLELIAALDRRVPQVHRAGEASIARDAAALRDRAVRRIEELEREPMSTDRPAAGRPR